MSLLLSKDHPIDLTLVDEQVDAEAESVNGDETSESFAGLLTVTPASAGSESVRTAEDVTIRFLKSFIGFLCDLKAKFRADSPLAFSQCRSKTYSTCEWAVLRGTKEMYQVLLLSNL